VDKIKSLLKSDTSKDTIISLVGSGVVAVAGVVFTILLARVLEPDSFGVYSSLAAIVGIISVLGDLGIGSALINFLPKMPNKRKVLIATSFWFQVVIALVFSLLISFSGLINNLIVPGSIPLHFVFAGLLTGVYVINQYAIGLLKAEKKFLAASIVQSIDSIAKLAIVSALFLNSNLTISLALVSNIISVSLSSIYGMRQEFKRLPLILPKLYLKKIFSFAKWIGLSRAFGVAVSRLDIILLNLMDSSFSAGIFAAATLSSGPRGCSGWRGRAAKAATSLKPSCGWRRSGTSSPWSTTKSSRPHTRPTGECPGSAGSCKNNSFRARTGWRR